MEQPVTTSRGRADSNDAVRPRTKKSLFRKIGAWSCTDKPPTTNCEELVQDAENLLEYAAQSGVEIDDEIHEKVSAARQEVIEGKGGQPSRDLLFAITKLSDKLKPVSAESLRKCASDEARSILIQLPVFAVFLTILVVAYSIYAFMASAICEAITKDIDAANALAVTLSLDVQQSSSTSVPKDETERQRYTEQQVRNLQQFTTIVRAIDARALEMKRSNLLGAGWIAGRASDPFSRRAEVDSAEQLQLPADLTTNPKHQYSQIVKEKIEAYQKVRHFAQRVQEAVLNTFGAMTTAALPMLYALLGATAYLMRLFDAQIRARTFTGGHLKAARWTTAAIAGAVIGLFTGFGTAHGVSLPPLALAFLVGYGVDAFFTFLDRLLQTTGQTTGGGPATAPTAPGHPSAKPPAQTGAPKPPGT